MKKIFKKPDNFSNFFVKKLLMSCCQEIGLNGK